MIWIINLPIDYIRITNLKIRKCLTIVINVNRYKNK